MTISTNKKQVMAHQYEGRITYQAPSNIALIKYWGKHGKQLPCNPSLSFTLSESYTQMCVDFKQSKDNKVLESFEFEGKKRVDFEKKMSVFLESIKEDLPFLNDYSLRITSLNSFPHSSGIASSASSNAALCMALVDFESRLLGKDHVDLKKASRLSRLGSGSASRSVSGPMMLWGDFESQNGSDDYAVVPSADLSFFNDFNDYIAIVSSGEKSVSSRKGHSLMEGHPFRDIRFKNARKNLADLIDAMEKKDYVRFINIVESEALELHGLMMNSNPSFILMEPNTLSIIHEIRNFRKNNSVPICFTLDAGPNVHILFPDEYKDICDKFIEDKIRPFTQNNIIKDRVGNGPKLISSELSIAP